MKRVLARSAVVVVVILGALLVYGTAIEPRLILDERRYEVPVPGLDAELDGLEVAVFADLQTGMWWANDAMVERVVSRTVAERPAAVLLAGDFLYSSTPSIGTQIDTVLRQLSPLLETGIPTYAVLGNHDHAVGASEELTRALEDRGVAVLQNEALPLLGDDAGAGAGRPYVVGLGATQPGLTDVGQALREVPVDAPRIVLMHNPTAFPRLPAGSAPLAVAGHTHCGQVALPGLPRWSYLGLTAQEEVVADGWAPRGYGAEGNTLFVTCGIGFSVVPVRIGAAPQLVFFTLRTAPAADPASAQAR